MCKIPYPGSLIKNIRTLLLTITIMITRDENFILNMYLYVFVCIRMYLYVSIVCIDCKIVGFLCMLCLVFIFVVPQKTHNTFFQHS